MPQNPTLPPKWPRNGVTFHYKIDPQKITFSDFYAFVFQMPPKKFKRNVSDDESEDEVNFAESSSTKSVKVKREMRSRDVGNVDQPSTSKGRNL